MSNELLVAFNAMVQILKKVFDKSYRRELIDYNPCDRIEWDSDEYSNKFITSVGIKERTYTEREMDLLWDHEQSVIAKRPSFLTPYAMLLQMQLGLRRGEVCALHWDDITTDENGTRYLTIQRMLRKVPKHNGMPEHQVISQHTKTSKDRTIPLWKEVTDLLDAVYEISGDGTYIFPGEAADDCLGINSIYKHYTRACAAVGIPFKKISFVAHMHGDGILPSGSATATYLLTCLVMIKRFVKKIIPMPLILQKRSPSWKRRGSKRGSRRLNFCKP